MLKVYGNKKSRTSRVLWLLEELGLEYALLAAQPRSAEALALNPLGKIPVLVDGDAVITDSSAIMTYLADKHGAMTYPAGSVERSRQDGHMFFLLDEFDACLWTAGRHTYVLPEERRLPGIFDSLKWEHKRSQKQFVARLGDGPFLMGAKMTVPDIIAAHCGAWAIGAGFEITEPAYDEYIHRLRDRPTFKRAMKK